jgi:hypothetical protein
LAFHIDYTAFWKPKITGTKCLHTWVQVEVNLEPDTEHEMEIDEDVKSQVEEEICCQVVNRPTLKNDTYPRPYLHLGWATSEEELKDKFQRQTGYLVSTGKLEIHQVFHQHNPLKCSCDIHTTDLCLRAKCTVLYKENEQCIQHKLIVIAIIESAVVSGEQLDWLKAVLWESVFPRVKFISEGHDSISEDSRRAALQAINKKKKLSGGITEEEKEELK